MLCRLSDVHSQILGHMRVFCTYSYSILMRVFCTCNVQGLVLLHTEPHQRHTIHNPSWVLVSFCLPEQNQGQPAGVKEAREAGGGEGPVVLWDPKAAGLPPFSPTQNDFQIIPQHSSHDVLPANGHRFVMATKFSFALTCWYTTAGEGCHTGHRRLCSKHSQTWSSRTNRDSRCLPS